MAKCLLTVTASTPQFQIIDFYIDENGILDPRDLSSVSLPSQIDFTKGIIFSGKGPVWLFAHLVHQAHIAAWVATFDPRVGAVVVQTHQPAMNVGDIIPVDEILPLLQPRQPLQRTASAKEVHAQKIVAFLGPPHSGKTVLLQHLRYRLRSLLDAQQFQNDFFVLRACPDGEGDWFSDITADNGKLLRYKNVFDDAFVETVCNHLQTVAKTKQLVFVDCGGKIDKKNQRILNYCTHAILVSHSPELLLEWRGAVQASEVEILAEVESALQNTYEIISQQPLRLKIGVLSREAQIVHAYDELITALRKNE